MKKAQRVLKIFYVFREKKLFKFLPSTQDND